LPDPAVVAAAFPQLEILEVIGRGGMGVVYKARQRSLNRLVALKLLAPERVLDPRFAERFRREAQALAQLNHPNIVTIHDFGLAGEVTAPVPLYYLLMEYVDGVNLRQAMKAGRFTPEQALAIVPPVCLALQYAHERGIVHRDIKPENLLLDRDGIIKIADFGIARMLGVDPATPGPTGEVAAEVKRSAQSTGTILTAAGTPQYMAPEQREPGRADHRADIYSLGVVLYELLTGELPGARLEPPSHKVQIDVRLDAVVLRALAVEPELRYATAAEFRTQVGTAGKGMTPPPGVAADPSKVPRLLKTSGGFLYRPEDFGSFEGQMCPWRHRGQFVLDDERFNYLQDGRNVVIPLASIREVSIGAYPRSMNPAGLDLLKVRFGDPGAEQTVLLMPAEGWFAWPSTWNGRVAEWALLLRNSVARVTGREPAQSPREELPSTWKSSWLTYLLPLAMAVPGIALFLSLSLRNNPPRLENLAMFGMILAAIPFGTFVGTSFFFRTLSRQGGLAPGSANRRMGGLLVVAAVGVGLISLMGALARDHRPTKEVAVAQLAKSLDQARVNEGLRVLRERALRPTSDAERETIALERIALEKEAQDIATRPADLERGVARAEWKFWLRTLSPVAPLLLAGLLLLFGSGLKSLHGRRWFVGAVALACALGLWWLLHPRSPGNGLPAAPSASPRMEPLRVEPSQIPAPSTPPQVAPQPSHP
jgi:serine/threonine protein kinase